MTYTKESFAQVLEVLADQCIVGSLHLRMTARISAALEDSSALESFYFPLVLTVDAFHNSSTLHLIRLFERDSASLTLHRLLRIAKANVQLFTAAPASRVLEAIVADEQRLASELEPLLSTLKARRDSYVAHLDQRHLLKGSIQEVSDLYPLSKKDIKELWHAAVSMVARYYLFFHDCEFHIDEVIGEEDMDWLLEALKEQEKNQYLYE
ncbi:MAG TPA: hypothetical protein VLV54_21525 [Thermoanaerobaculia bacterium]|nr:hypothetical protein [Thermoanaerobaculia bacterium]